jgi:hypothetical protein
MGRFHNGRTERRRIDNHGGKTAGFFFATKPDTGRTGMEGTGVPVEAIEPPVCGGTPMKTPAPPAVYNPNKAPP